MGIYRPILRAADKSYHHVSQDSHLPASPFLPMGNVSRKTTQLYTSCFLGAGYGGGVPTLAL